MIKVFYSEIDDKTDEEMLDRYYFAALPPALKMEIRQYKFSRDRQIRIAGKMLLERLLIEFGFDPELLANIVKTQFGKPEIPDAIAFNISHSGNIVICAATRDQKIGVDIEIFRHVALTDFISSFSESEWQEIRSAPNDQEKFFDLWAKKESIVKADGRGMFLDLKDVILVNDTGYIKGTDQTYHLFRLGGIDKGCAAYLCTSQADPHIEVARIDLKSLVTG